MAADHEFAAALHRMVEHDYVRLVRAVALFSGTVDGAEDAVQEGLARALRGLVRLRAAVRCGWCTR